MGNLEENEAKEYRAAQDRLAAVWPEGVNELLERKNPELLGELSRLESVIDSLIVIPNKPTALRKQWNQVLADYEKTAMLCVSYTRRHQELARKSQGN